MLSWTSLQMCEILDCFLVVSMNSRIDFFTEFHGCIVVNNTSKKDQGQFFSDVLSSR